MSSTPMTLVDSTTAQAAAVFFFGDAEAVKRSSKIVPHSSLAERSRLAMVARIGASRDGPSDRRLVRTTDRLFADGRWPFRARADGC